jgi:hypothetical protein
MADQDRPLTRETANEGLELDRIRRPGARMSAVSGLRPASPGARYPSRRLLSSGSEGLVTIAEGRETIAAIPRAANFIRA